MYGEKINMRNCNRHIRLRFFLLALFISYYGDITFFTHYHVVNGVTIVHSHYFHSDPNEGHREAGHTHTSAEFTVIAHHSDFVTLTPDNPLTEVVMPCITEIFRFGDIEFTENTIPSTFHLRGPPLFA